MADDYKVQVNKTIHGDLWNIRANSASELLELLEGLDNNGDEIAEALGGFSTRIITKGVFTGQKGGSGKSGSSNSSSDSGGIPECQHGPMKDLTAKDYKFRYYCSSSDRSNQCKPQVLSKG